MCRQTVLVFTACDHRRAPITTETCRHYQQYCILLQGTATRPPQDHYTTDMQVILSLCRGLATQSQTLISISDYCEECQSTQINMMRAMQETAAQTFPTPAAPPRRRAIAGVAPVPEPAQPPLPPRRLAIAGQPALALAPIPVPDIVITPAEPSGPQGTKRKWYDEGEDPEDYSFECQMRRQNRQGAKAWLKEIDRRILPQVGAAERAWLEQMLVTGSSEGADQLFRYGIEGKGKERARD